MAAKRKASVLHKEFIPNVTKNEELSGHNTEDIYPSILKDADKLKLLLAWNYQNSNAVRNGVDAPDLGVINDLWIQYRNALSSNSNRSSISPLLRAENENQDETNSLGQKDDDGSEDDSDDKLDLSDPERLKAFNMFVRLFVDENLDRMIPISKQPKEKIQAIIDSCARQFPEFCERSRKRIRTYLKSCRRNKKTREGWDNISRPTPAHLTSAQAEQILAIACENESLNAKRMRIGLDPIIHAVQVAGSTSNGMSDTTLQWSSGQYGNVRAILNSKTTDNANGTSSNIKTSASNLQILSNSEIDNLSVSPTVGSSNSNDINNIASLIGSSPSYRSPDLLPTQSQNSKLQNPTLLSSAPINIVPTDLSMKSHPYLQSQHHSNLTCLNLSRAPVAIHKLSENEIAAARQIITAYRESAAFLLRTAEQVEQLLLQQQ